MILFYSLFRVDFGWGGKDEYLYLHKYYNKII